MRKLSLFLSLLFTIISTVAFATEPASHTELVPFTAKYTTEWKVGWFSIDINAVRQLKKVSDNHWQMVFEVETSTAKLRETSDFVLQQHHNIQPLHYTYRATGLFNEDDRTLQFQPDNKTVADLEKKIIHTPDWQTGIQDNLTYMLQAGLDLANGKTEFEYPVFEKKQSKPFRFRVVGEEILKTKAGTLHTIKVQQIRERKDREIFAWFAKNKHYLLVRLLDKKDGKKRYEINITDIKMK